MEIGDRPQGASERARGGFTLLEILLALALIGLIATVFIGVSSNLFAEKSKGVDDQFWAVCGQARKAALDGEHDILLSFDDKTKSFVLDAGPGDGGGAHSIPMTLADPKDLEQLSFSFLGGGSDSSSILIGGTLVETQTVPFVTFYSDGTCTPFKAQFRLKGDAHVLSIDPWTCAAMLPPPSTVPSS